MLFLLFGIGVGLLASSSAAWGFEPGSGEDEVVAWAQFELDLGTLGVFRPALVGRGRVSRNASEDVISTEILSMQLRAPSPLGPVTVRESFDRQSHGLIWRKTPGADFPANSRLNLFFDVVAELGTFHTDEPVVVEAMIDEIIPCGVKYRTPGTFQGVSLLGENGQTVGVVRSALFSFCQQPTFSVGPEGVSSLNPADLFQVRRALDGPAAITAANLGLQPTGDNVDGLSYGLDFLDVFMELLFSVDEEAMGLEGTAVRQQATGGEAHGDEFWMSLFGQRGSNALEKDEEEFELRLSDDVDALAEPPALAVDADANGVPDSDVYFSLSANSTTLSANSFSPADILRSSGGDTPNVFIRFDELGLVEEDDIDAFCLVAVDLEDGAPFRQVLFSLAPGSPSLREDAPNEGDRRSPSDLFLMNATDASEMPELGEPLLEAAELGLREEDNLNALKCVQGEKDDQPHSVLRIVLDDEEVDLRGSSLMVWAIGRNGESNRTNPGTAGADFGRGELRSLLAEGTTPSGRRVTARVRSSSKSPMRPSLLALQEDKEQCTPDIPWFLQIHPWGACEAFFFVDLQLELDVDGQILHNDAVIPMFGIVTRKPPALNEAAQRFVPTTSAAGLQMLFSSDGNLHQALPSRPPVNEGRNQDLPPIELLKEDGEPSGVTISEVVYFPNVSAGTPFVPAGAVVSAASFRAGAAPESIMALFGADLSDETAEATELPLPTELAGTSITVTDSAGNQAVAALAPSPAQQDGALAPLFFASPGQINFFMPGGLALGPATVDVTTADGAVASTSVLIVPTAPGIFAIDGTGAGLAFASYLLVKADGSRTEGLIFDEVTREAVPVSLGAEGDQLILILGGTGIRGFSGEITATVGGLNVPVLGAAAQGQFVGLDQVNIGPLPRELAGAGEVDIVLTVDGQQTNPVTVTIE